MVTQRKLLVILVLLTLASCGGGTILQPFRVALASSGPMVTALADSGAFPSAKASAIIADFNDGAQCGLAVESAFNSITDDLPEQDKTRLKLNASVTGLRCFKAVVDRQNFAAHPRVRQVAAIAEGVLASLVVFYSEPGEMRASTVPGTNAPRSEKELEAQLKKQVDDLKRAVKP